MKMMKKKNKMKTTMIAMTMTYGITEINKKNNNIDNIY